MHIHHLALRTRNLEALEGFYVALGFGVRRRSERSVWLAAGDAVLMLERASPDEPTPESKSLELIAFAVRAPEREAMEAKLASLGHPAEARTAHTLYARDPDGRRIGFSTYPLAAEKVEATDS